MGALAVKTEPDFLYIFCDNTLTPTTLFSPAYHCGFDLIEQRIGQKVPSVEEFFREWQRPEWNPSLSLQLVVCRHGKTNTKMWFRVRYDDSEMKILNYREMVRWLENNLNNRKVSMVNFDIICHHDGACVTKEFVCSCSATLSVRIQKYEQ